MEDFRETCRYCTKAKRWDDGIMIFTCQEIGLIGRGTTEPCDLFEDKNLSLRPTVTNEKEGNNE